MVLTSLAGAVLCGVACLLLRFRRQITSVFEAFVRMPIVQKAVLVFGMTLATLSAQKVGTDGADGARPTGGMLGANGIAVSSSPPAAASAGAAVSPADAARGYRLESVSTNDDLSCAMPEGAATVGTWRLTGAYDDVVRVRLDG